MLRRELGRRGRLLLWLLAWRLLVLLVVAASPLVLRLLLLSLLLAFLLLAFVLLVSVLLLLPFLLVSVLRLLLVALLRAGLRRLLGLRQTAEGDLKIVLGVLVTPDRA